jgi:hypothetical protein
MQVFVEQNKKYPREYAHWVHADVDGKVILK